MSSMVNIKKVTKEREKIVLGTLSPSPALLPSESVVGQITENEATMHGLSFKHSKGM